MKRFWKRFFDAYCICGVASTNHTARLVARPPWIVHSTSDPPLFCISSCCASDPACAACSMTSIFDDPGPLPNSKNFVLVAPTQHLANLSADGQTAASSLTLGKHFTTKPQVPEDCTEAFTQLVREKYSQGRSSSSTNRARYRLKVAQCQTAVYTKLSLLKGPPRRKIRRNEETIRNETELERVAAT